MTIRLRVTKVEQVVCNNYTLQVEPGELAKALSGIPARELQQILKEVKLIIEQTYMIL